MMMKTRQMKTVGRDFADGDLNRRRILNRTNKDKDKDKDEDEEDEEKDKLKLKRRRRRRKRGMEEEEKEVVWSVFIW